MKWAIELGEHEIHYLLHKAIKDQALADFLVELGEADRLAITLWEDNSTDPPDLWQLWVDDTL